MVKAFFVCSLVGALVIFWMITDEKLRNRDYAKAEQAKFEETHCKPGPWREYQDFLGRKCTEGR